MASAVAAAQEQRIEGRGASVERRGWLADAAVFGVYLALAFVVFGPIWVAGGATHMPAGGDQWRNVWFDQWTVHAVSTASNPLFSKLANYPGGVNVLVNAGAPFLSFLFSPVTVLFGPIAAYNLSLTLAMPFAAATCSLLIRRLVPWRPAAFFGGLLYGFGPEEMAHGMGHVNLSFTALVPLIMLCVYELVVRQEGRAWLWGIGLGLLVTGQFFISSEVLLETVLMSAVAVVIAAAVSPSSVRARFAHAARGILAGVVVAGVLLAWPVWFLARGPAHVSGPVQLAAQGYRANLLAPFVPDSLQLLRVPAWAARADHFASAPVENGSYLGLPLIALLVTGLIWRRRDKLVLVPSLAAICAFVLSLGGALAIGSAPGYNGAGHAAGRIPLPEELLSKLPLLENLIPSRFALQVTLFAAVAGACLLSSTHRRWAGRWAGSPRATIAACALAVLALLPLLPAGLVPGVERDVTPAGFTAVASRVPVGTAAVVFPYPSGTYPDPIMWHSDADLRFAMPGGSFFVPQGPARRVAFGPVLGYTYESQTGDLFTNLASGSVPDRTAVTREVLATEWRSWRIRSVIAVPGACPYPAQVMGFLTWLLGPPSAHSGGAYAWYRVRLPG